MWEIARILPSLRLPKASNAIWQDSVSAISTLSLRSNDLRLLPCDHPLLLPYIERFPAARTLLGGFRDTLGHEVRPSVLAVNSASRVPRSTDTLSAFRNCIAVAYVSYGRAAFLADHGGRAGLGWTDAFDFHPAEIDKRGRILLSSPALLHMLGDDSTFYGAPSPYVDTDLSPSAVDYRLVALLSKAWHDFYRRRKRVAELRSIFRALEIAYHAAAVPVKNSASIHDFGLSICLWISALECLLHTGKSQVNQKTVFAILGDIRFDRSELNRKRYRVRFGKKTVAATAIQKVCAMCYTARNHFLHGELVSPRLLVPSAKRKHATTFTVGASLFRMSLVHRLEQLYPPEHVSIDSLPDDWFLTVLSDDVFEKAFCRYFGLRSRPVA